MRLISKILLIIGIVVNINSITYAATVIVPAQSFQQSGVNPACVVPAGSPAPQTFPCKGVRIHNANTKTIDITIVDGTHCIFDSLIGGDVTSVNNLSIGANYDYTGSDFLHPTTVCVKIEGFTNLVAQTVKVPMNQGCVITASDNGFLRGVTLNDSCPAISG